MTPTERSQIVGKVCTEKRMEGVCMCHGSSCPINRERDMADLLTTVHGRLLPVLALRLLLALRSTLEIAYQSVGGGRPFDLAWWLR